EARVKKLVGAKWATARELESATASRERAEADLVSAKAQVMQAEANHQRVLTDLGRAVITSPVDGVVLTRNVEAGNTVAASFSAPELFVLAEDLTRMTLELEVDEADVGLIVPGQKAKFTVDAWPDETFEAEVETIRLSPTTTSNVVTYRTTLGVDNGTELLRPGMTATATITTETR